MSVAPKKLTLTIATLLLLTACNYKSHYQKSQYDYSSRAANDPKMMHVRSYGSLTHNALQHDNRYYEFSSDLSSKVRQLPGIHSALVFLTDKNAYIGILTDSTATGTAAYGGADADENNNLDFNINRSYKDPSNLSTELRQVIGDTIRSAASRTQEVHISANREFFNQSLEFAQAAWLSKPLAPLIADFNTLMKYTFNLGNEVPLPLHVKDKKTGK